MSDTKTVLRKLLSDHVGEQNAITQSQLSEATGLNTSTLRSELRRLREERNIPIANQRNGYYVINSKKELKDYIGHINSEINSKKQTIKDTLDAYESFDNDAKENLQKETMKMTYPCANCGESVPKSDIYYWESEPLCKPCWADASGRNE